MPVTKIVDLTADVLPFLQFQAAPADGGALVQSYIDGVTAIVEDVVGRVVNITVGPNSQTDKDSGYYDGGDTTIFLRETPVLSVTSITEVIGLVPYTLTLQPVGSPVDNFGFTLDDPMSGRVTRRSAGSQEFEFYDNSSNIAVTYVAGRATVPPNVKLATLELIKLFYVPEQESFGEASAFTPTIGRDESNDEEMAETPGGFLIPRRVYLMLQASNRRAPVIA